MRSKTGQYLVNWPYWSKVKQVVLRALCLPSTIRTCDLRLLENSWLFKSLINSVT